MKRRLIGVLGGMGPLATVDFLQKVIDATPAARDQDHVPLLIHAVPQIPDRAMAIASGSDEPFRGLLAGLRLLKRAAVDLVVMPCNTAHAWFDRLAASTEIRLLHIAEAVREALDRAPSASETIALMATIGTVRTGFYQRFLAAPGRRIVLPPAPVQNQITDAILAVKAGDVVRGRNLAAEASDAMLGQGAGRLLLACTELPVAMKGMPQEQHCLDATVCLAEACVAFWLDGEPVMHAPSGERTPGKEDSQWTCDGFRTS